MIHRIHLTLIISYFHFAHEDSRMDSELHLVIIYSFICLDPNTNKLKKKNTHNSLRLCFSLYTHVFG